MRRLRCLFVLSRDFGEYVTAQLFSRGQLFEACFAMPPALARFADAERAAVYGDLAELDALVANLRPDAVMLCSGYLFAVNGIFPAQAFGEWLGSLRTRGIAVATTDPWLALDETRPGARFTVYSVSRGGAAPDLSDNMARLHAQLRAMLRDLPHVYAVPVPGPADRVFSFFNPAFAASAPGEVHRQAEQWLFVLSRDDYTYLDGFEGANFREHLDRHVRRLAAVAGSRVVFVGPPALGGFFAERFASVRNIAYLPFCTAPAFERLVRESAVAGYWNQLSSSLLYCMYYRVPPVFFGPGHQIKIREGLHDHAVRHVYGGHGPPGLEWQGAWPERPRDVVQRLAIDGWLEKVAAHHAGSPAPAQLLDTLVAARAAT